MLEFSAVILIFTYQYILFNTLWLIYIMANFVINVLWIAIALFPFMVCNKHMLHRLYRFNHIAQNFQSIRNFIWTNYWNPSRNSFYQKGPKYISKLFNEFKESFPMSFEFFRDLESIIKNGSWGLLLGKLWMMGAIILKICLKIGTNLSTQP